MKPDIDLPEKLLTEANRLAAELGLSPAEFYEKALAGAVRSAKRRRKNVTEQVNAVWDGLSAEEKQAELRGLDAQLSTLSKEGW